MKKGLCEAQDYQPEVFLLCDFRHSYGDNLVMSAIIIAAFYKLMNKVRHGARIAANFQRQIDKYIDDAILSHSSFCHKLVHGRRRNNL